MALNRESIYGALWSRLQGLPGFVTIERRLRHFNDVPDIEQPYLGFAQTGEIPDYEVGRTTQWTLNVVLYVYVKDPAGSVPGALINPLIDAINAVFAFDNTMGNSFTLGGLALWARMGTIETDEGTLGEQAIARIPVTIRVTE